MDFWRENALVLIVVMAGAAVLFRFAMWVQEIKTDREIFRDFMKEIRKEIKNIHEKLDKIVARTNKMDN